MTRRAFGSNLRRRQLDRLLSPPVDLRQFARPREGWIREIRQALGMSASQLARRLSVGQSTVSKLEKTEREETISLRSLTKVAEAMDCTLVYAFVPRLSLEAVVEKQARQRATELVTRVDHTMALEAQNRSQDDRKAEVEELAGDLKRTLSRELWMEER
jgi:predicted DNA-binding mobile mystery protein A